MKKFAFPIVLTVAPVLVLGDQHLLPALEAGPSLQAPDAPGSLHVEVESVSGSTDGRPVAVLGSTDMPMGTSLGNSDFTAAIHRPRQAYQSFELGTPTCLTSSSA